MEHLDVLIIGGGPAGLTAALYLGRARRRVGVVDAGEPRHAVSDGVHNFISRDGLPPARLREITWEQMAAYPGVRHLPQTHIQTLAWAQDRWQAQASDGRRWSARAVLLATGVEDLHPEIPGFAKHWGGSIFHCPYCHGWESRDRALGLLAPSQAALHMLPLLKSWSADVTLLTHGQPVEPELEALLEKLGVVAHQAPVEALEGDGALEGARLAGGQVVPLQALFVASEQRQVPLVRSLDLELGEMGYVKVDELGKTSAPMMWAAGDVTTRMQQVVMAAAGGARAGSMIHYALVQQDWELWDV